MIGKLYRGAHLNIEKKILINNIIKYKINTEIKNYLYPLNNIHNII
jgi:hypothetical protein